jgi:uncharacterized protein DUF6624
MSRVAKSVLVSTALIAAAASGIATPQPLFQDSDSGEGEQDRIAEHCPHAAIAKQELQRTTDAHRPEIKTVTRPALQHELLLLEQRDQDARGSWIRQQSSATSSEAAWANIHQVDAANLTRLKQIVHQDGFPSADMVGYNGVAAAWLLLQHADRDPAFQASLLPVIARRAHSGELSPDLCALFFDRVRIAQGKKQRFGTQFEGQGSSMARRPTEDVAHLDRRRRAMGLVSMADYECVLHAVYDPPPNATQR